VLLRQGAHGYCLLSWLFLLLINAQPTTRAVTSFKNRPSLKQGSLTCCALTQACVIVADPHTIAVVLALFAAPGCRLPAGIIQAQTLKVWGEQEALM
jgi:hypothetical protein